MIKKVSCQRGQPRQAQMMQILLCHPTLQTGLVNNLLVIVPPLSLRLIPTWPQTHLSNNLTWRPLTESVRGLFLTFLKYLGYLESHQGPSNSTNLMMIDLLTLIIAITILREKLRVLNLSKPRKNKLNFCSLSLSARGLVRFLVFIRLFWSLEMKLEWNRLKMLLL